MKSCYVCGDKTEDIKQEIREGPATLQVCYNCGLIHLEPDRDLKEFYNQDYRKTHGPKPGATYEDIFNTYVKFQGQRLKALEPHLGKDKTLLDVGCSTGHFLWNIKDKVRYCDGVDWDTGAALYAIEQTKRQVYPDISDAPRNYDIVYSSMTMEHVEDPFTFVNNLKSKLAPKGTIYIEVPNLNDALLSVYKNEAYKKFYFRRAHLWYFTPAALQRLMEKAGFAGRIIFMQDYNIMNHLYWQSVHQPQFSADIGLKRLSDIDDLYRSLLCELRISDNMAFIGKLK